MSPSAADGLSGIRVLDFGHYVAGPLVGVLLANEGADVIHVDRPDGPASPPPADAFLNRGKRRITLDLRTADDRVVARRLIASADVVIENFRPGVMDRLGLGWEMAREMAPQVVYCSLPGFRSDDPRAALPGWEGVIAAATGNCWIRAGQAPPGWDLSRPTYTSVPVASNLAAFLAATSVLGALTARQATGRGQLVEVPLFNAMFEVIGVAGAYVTAEGLGPPRPLRGNGSGCYRCGDGRYVQFNPIGSSTRFLRWLLDAAGASDWAAEGMTDGRLLAADAAHYDRLCGRLADLFATRPAAEWEELGATAGVPLSMVRSGSEWLADEHARTSRAVAVLDDPELGRTAMAGLPVHTPASDTRQLRPRHRPDEDRAAILAELDGLAPRAVPAPAARAVRQPYEGLRVVDLTEILAGPTGGRILAELGADVVKINNVNTRLSAHSLLNRGKRSVLLDVESERGQEMFWKLVEQADVVIQNYPRGTAERYGIGYEHVRARRPDVVYVSVSCYGYGGPWESRRGYETQGQAVSGIMERAGGEYPPEVLGPYNVLDFGTGVMASFAASLAIFVRSRSGEGQHVSASLAQTATYHQASYLLDYPGKDWDVPRGPAALGGGPLERLYQARDGWFFLAVRPGEADDLAADPTLAPLAAAVARHTGDQLAAVLEEHFAGCRAGEVVAALQARGIGAHRLVSLAELMVDPVVVGMGLSITQHNDDVGELTMPGVSVRFSDTPAKVGHTGSRPGSDGAAVAASLGLDPDELSRAWVLRLTDLPAGWNPAA